MGTIKTMEVDDWIQKLILFMVVNQINYTKAYKSSSLVMSAQNNFPDAGETIKI